MIRNLSVFLQLTLWSLIPFIGVLGFPERSLASEVWEFRHFHTPEGKSLARSRDIVEDATGGIWVATWGGGVHYFNKTEWKNFTTNDGLPGDWVRCVEVDSSGTVWIGTGDGLGKVVREKVVRVVPPSSMGLSLDNVYLLEEMKDGTLWVGDDQGNVLSFDEKKPEPWTIVLDETVSGSSRVDGLAEEEDGTIWVTLRDRHLLRFDGKSWRRTEVGEPAQWLGLGPRHAQKNTLLAVNRFDIPIFRKVDDEWVPFPNCGRQVYTVSMSPRGHYYAGTDYGAFRFVGGSWQPLDLGREVGRPEIDLFHFARDGSLWIGTREGLVHGTKPAWVREQDLENETVIMKILYQDDEDDSLVGIDSENFLTRKVDENWERIASLEIDVGDLVSSVPPVDGSFWALTTGDGGRFRFRLSRISTETGAILESEELTDLGPDMTLFQTSRGKLWLLGHEGVLEKREGQWIHLPENNPDYPKRRVYTVEETEPDVFYLGFENGVEQWSEKGNREYGRNEGLEPNDAVRDIVKRSNGEIWFGTYGSEVYILREGTLHHIGADTDLLSNSITHLFETRKGNLWIAYRWIGVGFLNESRLINFSHPDGLPNNPVMGIFEDSEENIFLSTIYDGVYRYNPETDPPETTITAGPQQVGPHGIGVFSLRGWDAWNKTPYSNLLFSWGLTHKGESTNTIDWSPFQRENSIVTNSLRPGEYQLMVRASDRHGNIDPTPASFHFAVAAPFFMNPILWGLVALVLLSLMVNWGVRKKSHRVLQESNKSLKASEERFRTLVEYATDVIFLHDMEGNISDVNRQACDSLGYSREELLQLNIGDIESEIDLNDAKEFWASLETLPSRSATIQGLHRRKNGSTFPVEIKAGVFSSEGTSLILALARDVTERVEAEKALREREGLYRQAIEIAGAVSYFQVYEPDSYKFIGKRITELTGLTPEEFSNASFSDLIQETIFYGDLKGLTPPEAVKKVNQEEGLIWRADYRIVTKAGQEKWLSNSAVMVRNERSELEGSLGILQDITEEKEHQQSALTSLVKVNQQQTALKELATLGGGVGIDLSKILEKVTETSSNILNVERSSIWLFDETQSEMECVDLYSKSTHEHLSGSILKSSDFPNYFKALASDRVIDAYDAATDPRTSDFKETYLIPNGIFSMLDSPFHLSGKVAGVVCLEHTGEKRKWTADEISFSGGLSDCVALAFANSEQERVQEALAFSEERFRSYIEHITEGIFCFEFDPPIPTDIPRKLQVDQVSQHAILVECNDRFAWTFGRDHASDLLGERYHNFSNWNNENEMLFQKFVECNYRVVDGEVTRREPDGSLRYVLTSAHGIVKDGNLVRVWGIERDITQRKLIEIELEKYRDQLEDLVKERTEEIEKIHQELVKNERLAALGELIATVSHEMRNPLGTIRGSFFTLREKVLQAHPEQIKTFDRIERNILRCDRIIEELLDFTRFKELEYDETEVNRFLEEVLDEYDLPSEIRLVRNFESEAAIPLDRERFRRCLINILNNSCDAMVKCKSPKEENTLTLSSLDRNGWVEIHVEDTGEGIPQDLVARVSEPLYSTKGFGVGLGVSIAKQIIESHGGEMRFESKEGEGTTVVLGIPSRREQKSETV